MSQDVKISGHYINLDESEARRISLENNLRSLGLSEVVKRFPALRGEGRPSAISKSELGCFLSHKAIVDQADGSGFTLIFEDDTFLPENFKRVLDGVCKQNNDGLNWDLLFLGQTIHYGDTDRISHFLKLKKALNPNSEKNSTEFVFLDSGEWYAWGCQSYVIHPNALGKIKEMLSDAVNEGVECPIDTFYWRMIKQGKIASKLIFPYIVGLNVDLATTSTLTDRTGSFEHKLYHSMVNLFVDGADLSSMKELAYATFHEPTVDDEAFIASHIIYTKLSAR